MRGRRGGGFEKRPIRPAAEWRPGLSWAQRPASGVRHQLSYDHAEIAAFSARLRDLPPHQR